MHKENLTRFRSIIITAAILLLAQCILMYGDTGRDDAFFTYWSSKTLAEHGSILNYNGEYVEQSSTLLYTLLLAAVHKITPFIAIPTLSIALSLTAGFFTLLVTACTLQKYTANPISTLILAVTPCIVFWSCSGMETLVSAALFTSILLLCLVENPARQQLRWLALLSALAVLNRPETFLVLGCFAVTAWSVTSLLQWLAGQTNYPAKWLVLLSSTLCTAVTVSLWRDYYFGEWFPQPVIAKSSHEYLANIFRGINYLMQAGQSLTTQYILCAGLLSTLIALLYWKHVHRMSILIVGILAIAQIAFIIVTGGDWMDATRFLVPVIPALLLSIFLFLAPWKRLSSLVFLSLFMLACYDSWQFSRSKSTGLGIFDQKSALERYIPDARQAENYSAAELHTKDALRDIPQLEHLNTLITQMKPNAEKLNIASIQMGFIPYHLANNFPGRLQFLDMRALSTRGFSRCHLLDLFPRTENGIKISYDEFFGLLPNLERQCGIKKPDILYDLGYDMRRQVLEDNGYIITYLDKRHISGTFSARWIGSELFVAVRRELAARYQLKDIDGNIPALSEKPPENLPNIVLLIADDISYDHFGFMGNAAARTPTLDQLAQQGTVFTTGYVPTAFCRPSLATLLTGSWPHQTRIHANNGVIALPPGYSTLATLLQKNGYATFAGGKFWEDEPEWRGFDTYDVQKEVFARENQNSLWRFIDNNAGKRPLFIWWAPLLPHTPHNPPHKFLDAINRQAIKIPDSIPTSKQQEYLDKTRNLLAMNLWMDDEIHKLQEKLGDKNQLRNTLFVFLADNGFSHRSTSKSAPYDLGLRTPIIFSWQEKIPSQTINAPTNSINIYNTILDYAGADHLPSNRPQPGHSLRPILEQKIEATPEIIIGADYQAVTMKSDPMSRPERDIFALHLRDGDWKYIFYLRDLREENNADLTIKSGMSPFPTRNAGDEEIYFLPTDAYEEHNLADQPEQQHRLAQYRRESLAWWYRTGGKELDASKQCPAQPIALCQKLEAIQKQ